eukprot:8951671-Pyramimonas_sp.AAC.1
MLGGAAWVGALETGQSKPKRPACPSPRWELLLLQPLLLELQLLPRTAGAAGAAAGAAAAGLPGPALLELLLL